MHPRCGGLGAPLEEALRAEAPGLGQGRIKHSPRGADMRIIPKLEGDDPFCGLTKVNWANIVGKLCKGIILERQRNFGMFLMV